MGLLYDTPPRLSFPEERDRRGRGDLLDRLLGMLDAIDLRGRGGAAFPAAAKIRSARGRRPVLIVNACDGEPLVAKDTVLLRTSPGLVIDGAVLLALVLDAREAVLAVHAGSENERRAVAALAVEGHRLPRPGIVAVPPRYVSSEASALAAAFEGGQARPISKDRPLTEGRRRSILVFNAETVAQVALAWAGHRGPLTRLVTITGAVGAPGVVEVPDEVTLAELVECAGGSKERPQAVLVGGYGGTWLPWAEVSDESIGGLVRRGVPLGAGLIHVLGGGCPVVAVGEIARFLAGESAGQCGPCMFGLPAIAADWEQLCHPHTAAAAHARLQSRLPLVAGRGACHHPDGAVRQLATALVAFHEHLEGHRLGFCSARRGRMHPVGMR